MTNVAPAPSAQSGPPSYNQGGKIDPQQPAVAMMAGQPVPMMIMQPYQPAMAPYPYMMPPVRPELPPEFIPNDYVIPTVIIFALCCGLNLLGLMFAGPALAFSIMSFMQKSNGVPFYPQAKQYGKVALILDIIAVLWVVVCAVAIAGPIMGVYLSY
ncbi:PREDICTED: uncharacterized protein LOC100635936 isoform X2 [Amphimedon queenslandica]|uniref:Interferon-induced transmembrane protein n=1 Tax=Amphimedon queenslandica TaxID=400682 RepID=A0AAN0IV29_AMPQE|nr:PREDICTED: uncharacterized protein LOC100635936 isoform X2 [Amphimedon queenslandica]|eukprot:XP_011410539.1 PREDICTED: uncharacterized protein LOC100635936 isoform X2 [Amphimedon queenslandica]